MTPDQINVGNIIASVGVGVDIDVSIDIGTLAHRVSQYYKLLITQDVPDELARTLIEQFQRFMLAKALGFDYV